jgi:hypothetical protein
MGLRIPRNDYLDDVESEKNIRVIQHSQPGQRAAGDPLLFGAVHRYEGPAEIFACARFYFHEHQCVIVATDNVDFAAAASTEIAEEDFVTVTLQVSAR